MEHREQPTMEESWAVNFHSQDKAKQKEKIIKFQQVPGIK
jgi:hypothetical protein